MKVHQDPRMVCERCRPYVSMGTFDGVHLGHLSIIGQMVAEAHAAGTVAVVVVFDPHPRQVLDAFSAHTIRLLNTLEEKERLLRVAGVDHFVVMPFTAEIARLDYARFVKEYLFEPLHMQRYYAGHDHGFGRDREGGFEALAGLGESLGFSVLRVGATMEGGQAVSSSRIRRALEDGDVHCANRMLGYPYRLGGRVIYGNRIGNTIGYPTANIAPGSPNKLIPAMGVYAVWVELNDQRYRGMLNIGIRPTIDLHAVTIEVNIFDFDKDIYGHPITVEFIGRIREEKKFKGLGELRAQLARDREAALAILGA
ncbi:MAG: riboflavin biosynthesis protein RibF [Bacteroidales bacterium]|nr:riboflavin biosynthesis protein RibF [Bacteroidales bacterium]